MYLLKVGCSNVTIVLTLVGVLPLLGGALGLGKVLTHIDQGINYSWLLQGGFLFVFGLLSCGYRSCLYLREDHGFFVRKMLGVVFREDKFYFSGFNEILLDTGSGVVSADRNNESPFYTMSFVGELSSIDITDFIRKRDVNAPKSWGKIQSLAKDISNISGLKVSYSDKVKRINDLAE